MILRPATNSELLAIVGNVLADSSLQLDTRAMITMLLTSNLERCPNKTALAKMLNANGSAKVAGPLRFNRMLKEASAAGYLLQSAKQMRSGGSFRGFAFVVGTPAMVAAFQSNAEIDADG